MIREELLGILLCPLDRDPVRLADQELLARVNNAIREGKVTNRAGQVVDTVLEQGLINQAETRLYPVVDDIPKMLADESIALDPFHSEEDLPA